MPVIFGLPRIGYWQGWGLVLLAHILVKPGYPGSGSHGAERKKDKGWKAEAKTHFTKSDSPAEGRTDPDNSGPDDSSAGTTAER